MKYPAFLKKDATIYLVAPSYGSPYDPYKSRLEKSIQIFQEMGMTIQKGPNIFHLQKEESNTPLLRAKELMDAYCSSCQFVWSVAGGELMTLILPYLDKQKIMETTPKWFMGYSDNTIFTYFLTTSCDIASIYSYHPHSYCVQPWPSFLKDPLSFLFGKKTSFQSYEKYETEEKKEVGNPFYSFNLTEPVYWKSLNETKKETFMGRCIGGCLDVLLAFAGTCYDATLSFIHQYQQDGFIWYFDIFDLTPVSLSLALFKLKTLGWFKNVKGFLISRIPNYSMAQNYHGDLTYEEVLKQHLQEYQVPVLYDCDIGHVSPMLPMINGAIMKVQYQKNKAKIHYILK